MQQRASRPVLVVVGVLLVLVLVVAELVPRDSLIRSTWDRITRHETPLARILKRVRGEPDPPGRGELSPLHGGPHPA